MAMQTNEFFPLLAIAEPSNATPASAGWVTLMLRELGQSQATGFMVEIAKWSLLGAGLGIMVALGACFLFSRLGWYDLNWRFARGLRWLTFATTVMLLAGCGGVIGFWHGAIRGTEKVLTKSQLATEILPPLGDAIADGMAWVQICATSDTTNNEEIAGKLNAFRAGKWELHATQLLDQLDALQAQAITNVLAKIEASALERAPQFKGGLGEKLLHALLQNLGGQLLEKKIEGSLKQYAGGRIYFTIREQLPRAAVQAGDPNTLARPEISTLIVHDGIVPGLIKPLRSLAHAQQILLAGSALFILIVPPFGVSLARNRLGRSATSKVTPPPAPPSSP
jgi:hypothetical protein